MQTAVKKPMYPFPSCHTHLRHKTRGVKTAQECVFRCGKSRFRPTFPACLRNIRQEACAICPVLCRYLYFLHEMRLLDVALMAFIAISLAFPVFIWMRPHWQDMLRIETAAPFLPWRAAFDNTFSTAVRSTADGPFTGILPDVFISYEKPGL